MPVLKLEIDAVNGLKDELDELMRDRLDEMEDEQVKDFYVRVKAQYKVYTKRAQTLMGRLIDQARINDSGNCRIDIMDATKSFKGIRQSVNRTQEQVEGSLLASSVASSTQLWVNSLQPDHPVEEGLHSPNEAPNSEFFHTAEVHATSMSRAPVGFQSNERQAV